MKASSQMMQMWMILNKMPGEGNDYGHLHGRILCRNYELSENDSRDFEVYRTDKDGDIPVKSDGKWLFVEE